MYLEKDGLRIRNAQLNDIPILLKWWNDGKVMAHAGFPYGLGISEEKIRLQLEEDDDRVLRHLIIEYKGKAIGEAHYRDKGDSAEIGIKICEEEYQEKKLGRKALALLIRELFEMGYVKIVLDTDLANTRAQHVYELLGFEKSRVNYDSWKDQTGALRSSVDYALRKEDFVDPDELLEEKLLINGNEYRLLKLLGHGKGGYSYLAKKDGKNVLVKKIHHEPCDYYEFSDKIRSEQNDYETLLRIGIELPRMIDIDMENEVIVKEYIPGRTIAERVENGETVDEWIIKVETMADLCKRNGINIDYYPTNFIPWDGKLYYIDYECNPYMEEWDFDHWGRQYWKMKED